MYRMKRGELDISQSGCVCKIDTDVILFTWAECTKTLLLRATINLSPHSDCTFAVSTNQRCVETEFSCHAKSKWFLVHVNVSHSGNSELSYIGSFLRWNKSG